MNRFAYQNMSTSASGSSSLVSIHSHGSRSRSQSQSPMPIDNLLSDPESGNTDWKARYYGLEAHYKEQIPKIREAMARMAQDLEKRYHEAAKRAKLAEKKAKELERNGTPGENGSHSAEGMANPDGSHKVEALETMCKEKDKEIISLHVELEEQRKLRVKQDQLIKEKTTAIREYVNKKVKELEQQNTIYQSENKSLRLQVDALRQRLQALSPSKARDVQRLSQCDTDTRPTSTMSEDSFCPPVPKRPSSSILASIQQEREFERLQDELTDHMQTELSLDLDDNIVNVVDDIGGDYQEIDDNHESKYEPKNFGPPQVRIERKIFPKHAFHEHTTSIISSTGGSEEMLDRPAATSSMISTSSETKDAGNFQIGNSQSGYSQVPMMQRRAIPSKLTTSTDSSEPLTLSPKSPPSPLTPHMPMVPPNSPSPHGPFSSNHTTHTVSALATLPRHNKGTKMFVYTPPREYETQTIDRRLPSKDTFERSQSERFRPRPKPPTPPLRRLPSWESRIYAIANIGLRLPEAGNLNNRVSSLPVTDDLYTDQMYSKLTVPVYTTVRGRAAQIRSTPFSGDSSSDSSDNEECGDVAMTTGGEEDGPGASRSTPKGSPIKSAAVNPGTPRATKRAVSSHSIASETSSDYALPPDDDVSIQTDSSDTSEPEQKLLKYNTENLKKDGLERCGYLTKLGGKVKSWRRRWFVLKNGELLYYKSHLDMSHKPQGHIALDDRTSISRSHSALTFEVTTLDKKYYLTSDSSEDMELWIKVLQNVLKNYAAERSGGQVKSKEVMKGWLIKTKNGRSRRCWCVLMGKFFMYYKSPEDKTPLGQILLRDARVDEVDRSCDSESDSDDTSIPDYTLAIWPVTQGPTYLMIPTKHEKDSWLYHLTVASGGGSGKLGTEYEQLISKLMESESDSAHWKQAVLLHSKDPLPGPLTTLPSEDLQQKASELFRCIHSFTNIAIESPQLDQHVSLAQNVMAMCLQHTELQNELYCQLIKQSSPHPAQHRSHMQNFLLCGSSSWFLCDASPTSPTNSTELEAMDSKLNPSPYVFVQGWQLLAMAISLFVPKQRVLWYLKAHFARHGDTRTECGKYAVFCQRALERTSQNGGRESPPSRMEVLSILLRNPYHHSQPISIPVHFLNGLYQVVSFDGSTSVQEFIENLNKGLGMRELSLSGFALFTDDPAGRELEHCLKNHHKICDVIANWEKGFLRHASLKGRADTSRTVKLTYKNRLYFKSLIRSETEKERLLLTYQINDEIVNGRFPLNRDLAVELAALLAQVEFGDYRHPGESIANTLGRSGTHGRTLEKSQDPSHLQLPHVVDKFYPKRYKDLSPQDWRLVEHIIKEKWIALHGRTAQDCVRIYLTVARGWQFFGAKLISAKLKRGESSTMQVWLAIQEEGISVLDFTSLKPLKTYEYKNVVTFGGHRDDFMLVVHLPKEPASASGGQETRTCRLLFAISKPKIYEVTMLMASYINARGQHRAHQRHLQQMSTQSQASQGLPLTLESTRESCRDTVRTNSSGTLKLLPNKPCKPIISTSIEV